MHSCKCASILSLEYKWRQGAFSPERCTQPSPGMYYDVSDSINQNVSLLFIGKMPVTFSLTHTKSHTIVSRQCVAFARLKAIDNALCLTCSSLMVTHELGGNPCNIGTRNCKHPLQWPMRSIMQIKLNIFMKTDAMLRNCRG